MSIIKWDLGTVYSVNTVSARQAIRRGSERYVIVCVGCGKSIRCDEGGSHRVECASCGKKMNVVNIEPAREHGTVLGWT